MKFFLPAILLVLGLLLWLLLPTSPLVGETASAAVGPVESAPRIERTSGVAHKSAVVAPSVELHESPSAERVALPSDSIEVSLDCDSSLLPQGLMFELELASDTGDVRSMSVGAGGPLVIRGLPGGTSADLTVRGVTESGVLLRGSARFGLDDSQPEQVEVKCEWLGLLARVGILDLDGVALGARELQPGGSVRAYFDVDLEGRGSGLRLTETWAVPGGVALWVVPDELDGSDAEKPGAALRLALSAELATGPAAALGAPFQPTAGWNELGSVDLVALPLLVEGDVRMTSGEPLVGISVQPHTRRVQLGSGAALLPRVFREARSARTDKAGHFRIFGGADALELELSLDREDLALVEPARPAPGDRDVQLVAAEAGRLVGGFDFSGVWKNFDPLALRLALLPSGVAPSEAPRCAPLPGAYAQLNSSEKYGVELTPNLETGTFGWARLLPGSYDLFVRHERAMEPRLVIEGLIVAPGEELHDPRVLGLDPRALFESVRLDVQGSGLEARDGGTVVSSGGEELAALRFDSGGAATAILELPELPVAVRIVAPLQLERRLELTTPGILAVQLERAPRVDFATREALGLPKGTKVFLRLWPADRELAPSDPRWPLGASGAATVSVPAFGRVAGRLEVEERPRFVLFGATKLTVRPPFEIEIKRTTSHVELPWE